MSTTTQLPGVSGGSLLPSTHVPAQHAANPPIATVPTVTQKVGVRTSFFDFFRSEKTIERNNRHAVLMARIEAYSKIEAELKTLNKNLNDVVEKLNIGTGNATKTFLVNAIDNSIEAVKQSNAHTASLLFKDRNSPIIPVQVDLLYSLYKTAMKNVENLEEIYKRTKNVSVDVMKKLEALNVGTTEFTENFNELAEHSKEISNFQKKYEEETRAANSKQNIDGADSDSD